MPQEKAPLQLYFTKNYLKIQDFQETQHIFNTSKQAECLVTTPLSVQNLVLMEDITSSLGNFHCSSLEVSNT